MRRDCLPAALSGAFYVYGKFVARHPLPLLVTPLLLTCLLASGFYFIDIITDVDYLSIPVDAPGKVERSRVEETFRFNDEGYYSSLRRTRVDGMIRILVKDKYGGNVFTDSHMKQLFQLNSFVINDLNVSYKNEPFYYKDVCARWKSACANYENTFLEIMANRSVNDAQLTYPFYHSPNGPVFLSHQLGSAKTNGRGFIYHVGAVLLQYNVRFDRNDLDSQGRSSAWARLLTREILKYNADDIDVNIETFLSLDEGFSSLIGDVLPLFTITFVILALFAFGSLLMADWVLGKPYIGIASMVAATLGGVSGIGLLIWCGIPYSPNIGVVLFLFVGIGLDDMYILVSAWRCTNCTLPVEERIGLMLRHSAVSITITSITDALAFGIGCVSPFRGMQFFCAFSVVGVIFGYFYQLSFVLACMVYDGHREHQGRHCITLRTVNTKDESRNQSVLYRLLCTGSSKQTTFPGMQTKGRTNLPYVNQFMGTTFVDFLMKTHVKLIITILYVLYLLTAIYGITMMKQGLDQSEVMPQSSYYVTFLNDNFKYFGSKFFDGSSGLNIMVVYDEPLAYTDPIVQSRISDDITRFKQDQYFRDDDTAVISWLYDYRAYLNLTSRDISQLTEDEFIAILRQEFLAIPGYHFYVSDLIFNENNTRILASRCFIRSKTLEAINDEAHILAAARSIAKESELNVYTFHLAFPYFDQFAIILPNTLRTLGIASLTMLIVALVFIPSVTSALWVALTIVSIETGVMGYMVFCDINLDSLSMVNLIMCIGFSVDFAAHISCHFTMSDSDGVTECARDALSHLGPPILQSAVSTIVAVSVLSINTAYVFRVFFIIVTLIMLFGSFHALFLLPILLSAFKSCCTDGGTATERSYDRVRLYRERVGLRLSHPLSQHSLLEHKQKGLACNSNGLSANGS